MRARLFDAVGVGVWLYVLYGFFNAFQVTSRLLGTAVPLSARFRLALEVASNDAAWNLALTVAIVIAIAWLWEKR